MNGSQVTKSAIGTVYRKRKKLDISKSFVHLLSDLNKNIYKNTAALNDIKTHLGQEKLSEKSDYLSQSSDNFVFSHKTNEKVIVEIRVIFLKIGEIDTIKEQFQAEAFIEAKWKEKNLKLEEIDNFDPQKYWNPMIEIENAVGELKQEYAYKVILDSESFPKICEMRKIKGVFLENLELYDFPDLSITITTTKSYNEIDFIEDPRVLSTINTNTFIDQQEWKLHEHVETFKRVSDTKSKSKRPGISFTCHASRRPGYFYWNVYFLIFFITIMIFATFSVKSNLPQNRLQLGFTLLLTAVTFKFVVNRCLPTISYLTSLDKYVIASMVFLCVICAWHAAVSIIDNYELYKSIDGVVTISDQTTIASVLNNLTSLNDPKSNNTRNMLSLGEKFDRYALIIFVLIYVLLHFLFILWMYLVVYKRRREMIRKDKKYLELFGEKGDSTTNTILLEEFELNKSNSHMVHFMNNSKSIENTNKSVEEFYDSKPKNGKVIQEEGEKGNSVSEVTPAVNSLSQLQSGIYVFEKMRLKKYKRNKKFEQNQAYADNFPNTALKQQDNVHFGQDIYDIRHISAAN